MRQFLQMDRSDKKKKITFNDVVHDEVRLRAQDPRADFSWIMNAIFPPRRRTLYPVASQSSNLLNNQSTQMQQQSRIIVTIISASKTPCREQNIVSNVTPFLSSPPPIRRLKASNLSSSFMTGNSSSSRIPEPESTSRRIPFRSSSQRETSKAIGDLNPIVQLKFCGKIYETRPGFKVNPSWKQVIEMPLPCDETCGGDCFSPLKLKELDEALEIYLFDTVSIDVGKVGGYYEDEQTVFTEKRFLGSLKIPFGTAFNEDQRQGSYLLDTPDIILGYDRNRNGSNQERMNSFSNPTSRPFGDDIESQFPNDRIGNHSKMEKPPQTSLSMLLSLQPSVPIAESNTHTIHLPSNESPMVSQYAMDWMTRYERTISSTIRSPRRTVNILVNGFNHKQNLITRFLRSQPPPPECQGSLNQCAHYVSLIPSLDTWKAFQTVDFDRYQHGIWQSSQDVLDITAANWNERAALLANYFMFISQEGRGDDIDEKLEVFLVMGTSITEGHVVSENPYLDYTIVLCIPSSSHVTHLHQIASHHPDTCFTKTYVMTRLKAPKKHRKIRFWNPCSGMCFAEDDETCPLANISLLIEPKEMYANLQREGKPCLMDFDLHDDHCWQSFFASSSHLDQVSIQPPTLSYEEPNDALAAMLESELTDKIKSSVRSWRRTPSSFHSETSHRLRMLLDDLEERKRNGLPPPSSAEYYAPLEVSLSLSGIMGTSTSSSAKKLFGFPLHVSRGFTNVDHVLETLKATAIHESRHPQVEFAAAARVFPYASRVFSVWVFVCTIVPD